MAWYDILKGLSKDIRSADEEIYGATEQATPLDFPFLRQLKPRRGVPSLAPIPVGATERITPSKLGGAELGELEAAEAELKEYMLNQIPGRSAKKLVENWKTLNPYEQTGAVAGEVSNAIFVLIGAGAAGRLTFNGFLSSSIKRNLRSWAGSIGKEIPKETEETFIKTAMANLSKRKLTEQSLKTMFKPTKGGITISDAVAKETETAVAKYVSQNALRQIPKGTLTGALAFGGLPKEVPPIIPKKVTPVTPEVTIATRDKFLQDQALSRNKILIDEEIKKAGNREVGMKVAADRLEKQVDPRTGVVNPENIKDAKLIREATIPQPAIPKAEVGMPEAGYQPAMMGVTEKEVRPAGKGRITQISMEEQLKLEQARRAAEEAAPEVKEAYEAQAEIEGLKATHQTDPIAQARFKLGGKNVDLTAFTSLRERAYPDYFTVKQAEALFPGHDFSAYTQKGTKQYNHVPRDVALDDLTKKFNMTPDEIANRVMQIATEKARIKELESVIKTQMTGKALVPKTELTPEEVAENLAIIGQPKLNMKQINALTGFFGDYIESPTTVKAWELTRELRRETRAGQAENLKARAQELIVSKGINAEEGMKQAIRETLSGELPVLRTEYLQGLSNELTEALFAKGYYKLKDDPFEMASFVTALTNALTGKPIPRERPTPPPGGFKSRIFPQGASAYDKLEYVFGDQPKVLKAIDKMATEKKPLTDVVEGIYHETGREPIPIDQEMADYLRGLAEVPFGYKTLLEKPFVLPSLPPDIRTAHQKSIDLQNFKLELTPDTWKDWTPQRLEEMSYLRINLLKPEYQTKLAEAGWTPPSALADQRTPAQRALDLDLFKIEMAKEPIPVTPYETPIEDGAKQIPLLPRPIKDNIIRALKEIGMLPVDIGNFLRANKASFDFSFWRQQAPLIASHPISFLQANIEAWKALWSQKSAEASMQRITRDPIYQIYEECERAGGDFLRPLVLKKGTAQWRGVEEYGYLTGERLLPRLTAKIPWVKLSARSFETGTNAHNWLIFKGYYNAMLRLSEQYANGQKKLKVGEAFDITKEMVDFSKMQANFSARGSLGKFAATAPELSGLFFAPRMAIGRILSVKDLINANPRVRAEAWKNAGAFVSTFGGLVLLGALVGWWEVEKDPENAEYMSIRIGTTRIDPWGGYRQFLVFFARAITGTGVSSVTGAEYEADPINLIQTFIRGKASPLASLILDFWRGQNFVGEKVEVANKAQWAERIAPFAVWDIYEAYKDDPRTAMQVAIPAIVGAGVQTYTGDWKENWTKLGLPKYLENLEYGIDMPKYQTDDFWADTAKQFIGVDPATLTAEKGFPEYIRAIVGARVINEHLATLPPEKLVSLNADPTKGLTFADYYKQWKEREKLVTDGDKAELTLKELQPDGKYKEVTYKGEKALIAFDANKKDNPTRNANRGNFSQRQFALLMEYWAITSKREQGYFLKLNKDEIGVDLGEDYLEKHPKENAQLAIWGQANIFTKEAYNQFKGMLKTLDIPDNAIPKEVISDLIKRIPTFK